jgi:hypothetical protein
MSTSSVDIPTMTDNNGHKVWRLNGQIHRQDGPAIEHAHRRRDVACNEWYLHGELHREDGPAYEMNGTKGWYIHGKRHREDGPAFERSDGTKMWYLNGNKITHEEHSSQMTLVKSAL